MILCHISQHNYARATRGNDCHRLTPNKPLVKPFGTVQNTGRTLDSFFSGLEQLNLVFDSRDLCLDAGDFGCRALGFKV